MKPEHVFLTLGKELREAIRDRKTLAILILIPLVVYPVLTLLLAQVVAVREKAREQEPSRVAWHGDPAIRDSIAQNGSIPKGMIDWQSAGGKADILSGRLDLLMEAQAKDPYRITLFYDASRDRSRKAEERISGSLEKVLPPHCAQVYSLARENLAPRTQVSGYLLSKILPILVILMVLMGAFHPAVDVTAGERERGTLETLLTAPIRRTDLLLGKVLAVATLASLSGLLNLGSMALTLLQVSHRIAPSLVLPWGRVALASLVVFPAGLLFSTIFVALGATARTHKEAQYSLLPVYLLAVVPAIVGSMGDYPLGWGFALLPGMNLTLLARDLLAGHASVGMACFILGVTLLQGALAIHLGARYFDSERLILGPIKGTSDRPARDPSTGHALVLFALAILLSVYVFIPLQTWNLTTGILLSQWLGFGGLVWVYARYCRRPLADVLRVRMPGKVVWLGAGLIGCSAWVWVGALSEWIIPVPKEVLDELRRLLLPDSGSRGLVLTLLLLAVTPGICEEALFRGPILRGLRSQLPSPSAALVTGILFGVLHFDLYRLLPTTLLGILLSYLALASGSILPSMLAHVCNNASLVLVSHFGWDTRLETLQGGSLLYVLAPSLLATLLGGVLIQRRYKV